MLFPLRDENPSGVVPWVTYGIIAINSAVMIATWRLPPDEEVRVVYQYGFVPARLAQLETGRPIIVPPRHGQPFAVRFDPVPAQIIFSMFSCMFLHAGLAHILGNMWFLWIFGDNVEHRLGHIGFAFFYLAGGVAATLCHWAMNRDSVTPVIGASGAVGAVLGAYAVAFPWARVRSLLFIVVFFTLIELPALIVLGLWFVGQLLSAHGQFVLKMDGGVAFWAHVGGFAAGAILMAVHDAIVEPQENPPPFEYVDDLDDRPW